MNGRMQVQEGRQGAFITGVFMLAVFFVPLLLSLTVWKPETAEAQSNRYDIENSLNFVAANSMYLSKNFWAVGSTTKWTYSLWVKRDRTGTREGLLVAYEHGTEYTFFGFGSNDKLWLEGSGSASVNKQTTATYTSTTDWYHIVLAVDTSQATAANRNRFYVNGSEVTSFSTDTNFGSSAYTHVTDNNDNAGNAITHLVGNASFVFDGLMADVILVDGKQLTPSDFGYDDGGTWRPKDFVAATTSSANSVFGTNGFRLDFTDRSNLGKDRSGRGNDFTLNAIGSAQQSTTTPQATTRFGAASSTPSGELFINGDLFFTGELSVAYSLSKGAGSFVIDHVLDPLNKLLYHSFVESPDMKNIYDGVAQLNEKGEAKIELPKYFMALNRDYRYLGSPVGESMPNLHLSMEVRRKWFGLFGVPVFKIAGGTSNGKISWQVTGIRQDPYAKAYPIRTEVDKGPNELVDKGEYLHPELYVK